MLDSMLLPPTGWSRYHAVKNEIDLLLEISCRYIVEYKFWEMACTLTTQSFFFFNFITIFSWMFLHYTQYICNGMVVNSVG